MDYSPDKCQYIGAVVLLVLGICFFILDGLYLAADPKCMPKTSQDKKGIRGWALLFAVLLALLPLGLTMLGITANFVVAALIWTAVTLIVIYCLSTWLHERGLKRSTNIGFNALFVVLFGCLLSVPLIGIYRRTYHPFDVGLHLITTIQRVKDPAGGYMKGGQNDLVGILRVKQYGLRSRHVKSLQIIGDVAADFDSYSSMFSKGDGTETIDELERRYLETKPFYHISWVCFPIEQRAIDATDEEFIKFHITQSLGSIVMTTGAGVSGKDYFGFWSTNQHPKFPLTSPAWWLIVNFSTTNRTDLTGLYPVLRDEVKTGGVKFIVDIDGELVSIPVKEIKFPWAVSLNETYIDKGLSQDLYYGIDRGNRTAIPTTNDPLVKSTQ